MLTQLSERLTAHSFFQPILSRGRVAQRRPARLAVERLEARQVLSAAATIDLMPSASDTLSALASDGGLSGGTGLFAIEPQIDGSDHQAVALGDLDGDGDLDAFIARAVSSARGASNAIWINDASGRFSDSGQELAGPDGASASFAVALGDLDGDGDLDAFVGNIRADRVWFNDGKGTFQDSGQALGDSETQSVALGDVDHDGDLDAFVGDVSDGGANRLWLNEGNGTFRDSGQRFGAAETQVVLLGDLDGDGDLDAFAGNKGGQPNKVWLNDGNGQFHDSGQEIGKETTWDASLGDVDGDGDLDVLVGNGITKQTKIWLNDGSGTFSLGHRFGKVRARATALGDLDGDGDLDALIGLLGPDEVWLNDGLGEFSKGPQLPFYGSTSLLNLGDLDADGDLDVLVRNRIGTGRPSSAVWRNRNQPLTVDIAFTDLTDQLGFDDPGESAGAAWFDYNNDHYQDLYVNGATAAGNRLYRNNQDGSFTDVTAGSGLETTVGHAAVVAGDLDNDGNVDLLLSGASDGLFVTPADDLKIFRNLGTGTFQDITESSGMIAPPTAASMALADIDGDSYLDVFITAGGDLTSKTQYASRLYHNNGDLTFTDITSSAAIDAALGACATGFSDYDNDGDQDLFVVNCNDVFFARTPVQLFRNNGDSTFDDVTAEAGLEDYGGFWMGVAFADYDQDGDIDLFATNTGAINANTPHALFENNGDGTFSNVAQRAGAGNWEFGWGAAGTDFNNDSAPDLFFAGTLGAGFGFLGPGQGNPGRLLLNSRGSEPPDRQFVDVSGILGIDISSTNTSGVAHADFDNDGFEDIFVMTQLASGDATPKLLLNSGNGNHWLGVELEGVQSNRDGVGARVTLHGGERAQVQEVHAGASFLSMDSQSLRFGLGQRKKAGVVEVQWPSAVDELFTNVEEVDQILSLREGEGIPRTVGDVDIDGNVDADDTRPFAQGLIDPASYAATYGAPARLNGDTDGDGDQDFDDIRGFVERMGGDGATVLPQPARTSAHPQPGGKRD